MQIDWSAAERFLSYVDGEVPLESVWEHPAYDVARDHAALLGRDLMREDVSRTVHGDESAFAGVENVAENRDRIARLLDRVRARESAWTDQIDRQLTRFAPGEDPSETTYYLGIGYEFGIGVERGAYVNLNEPLLLEQPRQLLYTAVHECSHVCYENVHRSLRELGPQPLDDKTDQWSVFSTVFHSEAFATYAPLELRRADGNLGRHDHVICDDYRALADDARLRELVAAYDSFRETLRNGSVSRETLAARLFGEPRLPYRVGCAMLDGLEEAEGMGAVREAFYLDAEDFCEEYDWVLDEYRN